MNRQAIRWLGTVPFFAYTAIFLLIPTGEIIVQVSQTDVTEPAQVIDKIEALKKEGRRTVMLLVSGADKKLRFVSLKIADAK